MEEIWKDVVGYEGLYQVSNLGKVRSVDRYVLSSNGKNRFLKGREMLKREDSYGYMTLSLSNKSRKIVRVHRLVADAFLSNPSNLPCVNHKDRVPSNNTVFVNKDGTIDYEKSNLEWCTYQYNNTYQNAVELRRNKMINNNLSVAVAQYSKNGSLIATYPSQREASRKTGIKSSVICNACAGRFHTAGGFVWRIIDINPNNP